MADKLNLEAERVAFEAHFGRPLMNPDRPHFYNGRDARSAWEAWQASAARRAAPIAAQLDAEGLLALPDHPEPRVMQWSSLEKKVIRQAQRDAKALGYALGRGAAVRDYIQLQDQQPAQSIDTPEFRLMLVDYAVAVKRNKSLPDMDAARATLIAYIDGRTAGTAEAWISVTDRLPDAGELVLVYSPPTQYDHPGSVNIGFDCIDPDADEPTSWLNHNEHYEHFCCVAKPEGSVGPSADAPYTHWKRVAAPSPQSPAGGEGQA